MIQNFKLNIIINKYCMNIKFKIEYWLKKDFICKDLPDIVKAISQCSPPILRQRTSLDNIFTNWAEAGIFSFRFMKI